MGLLKIEPNRTHDINILLPDNSLLIYLGQVTLGHVY